MIRSYSPIIGALLVLATCSTKIKIEPSDKPFIVNLNVKIDHEIRVKLEEKNKDLIHLEDEVLKNKDKKKKGTKS